MSGIQADVAIALLVAFLGGIAIGVILIASLASRREDHLYSLTGEPPDAACEGTRWLTGAYTRGDGFQSPLRRPGTAAADGTGHDDGPHGHPHGQETER
jgi:hypothetical protein